jgi:alkanesulfonate monooxygenase SsuD/methylene tetrahydromethanopterin reductase-like flavin-dependent oxidoreductase (luciferase family)
MRLRSDPRERQWQGDFAGRRSAARCANQDRLSEGESSMPAGKVTFGFTIPQRGVFFGIATWPEMIAMAREVDRTALFDSVWVGDSVMAKPRPESIALLGALAGATSRVKLGVGCMASFPIRDPIIFAYQWATLDLVSNGRMRLAACTGIVAGGVSAKEGAIWGITDGQRGNRMAENIAICRRLWSEDEVSYRGKYRSFNGITINPCPVQPAMPDLDRSQSDAGAIREAA